LSVGAQPSEKVNALIRKVKTNKFGKAKAPPPMLAPKVKEAPAAEAPAEAPAAE
jgi:small subunit ribosomal protein S16